MIDLSRGALGKPKPAATFGASFLKASGGTTYCRRGLTFKRPIPRAVDLVDALYKFSLVANIQ